MALTTGFVTAVRRQGSIPSTFTSTDILSIADEEIQGRFIPLLESLRQNYFVRELSASPDARGRVPLPYRAVGAALRSVQLSAGNGWFSLPLRDLGEADYQAGSGMPEAYAIDGGSIILLPHGSTGTLRIRYAARPGKMVLNTDAASCKMISAVTVGATTTAITAACTGDLDTPAGAEIVSAGPAHQSKAPGAVLTGTQPNLTVQNVDLIEVPIVGDYVSVVDTSPFVPLPEELYSALVHAVAANILLQHAYLEEASAQEKRAADITDKARLYLQPRNEGNPQAVKGGLRRALAGNSRRGRR